LRRSTPAATKHPFGQAATLGGLSWPDQLHCPLAWTDDPAGRYLRDARQLAATDDLAAELTAAVDAATPNWHAVDRWRSAGIWDWPRLAALSSASRLFLTDPPEDRQLQQRATAVAERLRAAEQQLRDAFRPDWDGLPTPNAAAGRQLLHRACAAHLVLDQYATRDPGPLWRSYQARGWEVARGVAVAGDPATLPSAEDLEALGELLVDDDPPAAGSPYRWALIERLQDALLWHGQESWTYHRLWDLAGHSAARPWLEWFGEWASGATFSWGGLDAVMRGQLLDPAMLAALLAALHAADAVWTAFLDGLATGAQQPTLCAFREPTVYPGSGRPTWLAGALTLAHPVATTGVARAGARRSDRWVVAVLPQVAAAALGHLWVDQACAVPLPNGAPDPEALCATIADDLGRLADATPEQVAGVVHGVLAGGPGGSPG
jgi:hypothetical protein